MLGRQTDGTTITLNGSVHTAMQRESLKQSMGSDLHRDGERGDIGSYLGHRPACMLIH